MAVSRPFVLALLGVALLGATILATGTARERAGDSTPAPTRERAGDASPAPTRESQARRPAQASPGGPVRSGRFLLRVTASGFGTSGPGRPAGLVASGRFQSRGRTAVPEFQIAVDARGGGERIRAGAVSVGSRGFLTQGDVAYPVPARAWSRLGRVRPQVVAFARRAPRARGGAAAGAGVDPERWLSRVERRRPASVDGVEARHVSGTVDLTRAVRALGGLGPGGGVAAPGIPPAVRGRLARVVRNPRVDLYVGRRDGVLRRFRLVLPIRVPPELRSRLRGSRGGRVTVDYRLSDVGRPQRVVAPRNVSSRSVGSMAPTPAALASTALGVGLVAIDLPELGRARRAGFRLKGGLVAPAAPIATRGLPRAVARALAARRTVVIFFFQRRALDDRATARAVAALRGRRGVAVFTDVVSDVGRYGPLVRDLGISQAPAIVIVDRSRRARLIEGYVDRETLQQELSDLR